MWILYENSCFRIFLPTCRGPLLTSSFAALVHRECVCVLKFAFEMTSIESERFINMFGLIPTAHAWQQYHSSEGICMYWYSRWLPACRSQTYREKEMKKKNGNSNDENRLRVWKMSVGNDNDGKIVAKRDVGGRQFWRWTNSSRLLLLKGFV